MKIYKENTPFSSFFSFSSIPLCILLIFTVDNIKFWLKNARGVPNNPENLASSKVLHFNIHSREKYKWELNSLSCLFPFVVICEREVSQRRQ
jgi:hypothetical protein